MKVARTVTHAPMNLIALIPAAIVLHASGLIVYVDMALDLTDEIASTIKSRHTARDPTT